jgi:UDP-galactopyranose mutase
MKFAIVGSGFSGSVLAQQLSKKGHKITLYESRNHIGGNCFTERDLETNIIVHKYGPHIFHTDNKKVWDYITNFGDFVNYIHRVKINYKNQVYSLPVNLHTINQFYKKDFNPKEAENFITLKSNKEIKDPRTFEEQALAFIGDELYNAFFKGYTKKQWGMSPTELPASILKRLPIRFNYDDNYFNHTFQGMPKNGYTPIFEALLDNANIELKLNTKFLKSNSKSYDHVFYTGPIDSWFNFSEGKLGYRTLDFKESRHDGDFQGCSVMNYSHESIEHTRITEHKHFTPWENHEKSIIFTEYSRECTSNDIPYYPIRLVKEKSLLYKYINLAKMEKNVSFLGRLGTYRYLDMDVTIGEALDASALVLDLIKDHKTIPVFFVNPLD